MLCKLHTNLVFTEFIEKKCAQVGLTESTASRDTTARNISSCSAQSRRKSALGCVRSPSSPCCPSPVSPGRTRLNRTGDALEARRMAAATAAAEAGPRFSSSSSSSSPSLPPPSPSGAPSSSADDATCRRGEWAQARRASSPRGSGARVGLETDGLGWWADGEHGRRRWRGALRIMVSQPAGRRRFVVSATADAGSWLHSLAVVWLWPVAVLRTHHDGPALSFYTEF